MIHALRSLALAHPVVAGIAVFYIFSNLVGLLPKPNEKTGRVYRAVYRFLHTLAGNLRHALSAKFPAYVSSTDPSV